MATRTQTIMTSDLSGVDIPENDGTTITFTLYGIDYEMDVTSKEAQRFDADMQKYLGAARRVGGRKSSGGTKPKTDREQLQAARTWLRANGHDVSDRGRIKSELMDLYNASQS